MIYNSVTKVCNCSTKGDATMDNTKASQGTNIYKVDDFVFEAIKTAYGTAHDNVQGQSRGVGEEANRPLNNN